MGRFMIPCCCICGKAPKTWNNTKWNNQGGLQDFCPNHVKLINKELKEYIVEHLSKKT